MTNNKDKAIELDHVVIRFSGDSGDGMQLTGTLFSDTAAILGNGIATFPDYPAEIRAPQGTVGGVSGFQVHFGYDINTPGDYADVLVAMNPAALKANAKWTKRGGTMLLDRDAFTAKNLLKAGYETDDPIKEDGIGGFNIIYAPISTMTQETLKNSGLDNKTVLRSKNMFALGICFYLFNKPLKFTEAFFEKKFKKVPKIIEANKMVLKAGYNYGYVVQELTPYKVTADEIEKGTYRNINGNTATAWGCIAAAEKANLPLFCGSYPITPATEILQELAKHNSLNVRTFQAEDEIGGITSAIGASFAGNFAVTTTSGPGLALKTEAIGLAMITELPLVIVNVQRGGPSTGLPTKTEQSDLLQAVQGRNGEAPVPVIAASTPSNCYDYAFAASKIALEHMTPVILLTDGFLANGSQPMKIENTDTLPDIIVPHATFKEGEEYLPYERDEKTLVRKWAAPGVAGLEHRIGGLEKMDKTGTVSYVPENHELMTDYRERKVDYIENVIPEQVLIGAPDADLLVVGWGGTYGHLLTAVHDLQAEGKSIALAHFNYIKPLPKNTEDILRSSKKVVVAELNNGQFAKYLRQNFTNIDFLQYNKMMGLPFTVEELTNHFNKLMEEK
ncbi:MULTISPECIES: 2-oxoacid:acceptor oxidoreductase subunit alpha [unclassified Lentimicrobium]|uniref:2-oxoacid:acceptor oxidoreductase subunit alpha n=1 Tax=unclassified Lentimicrobium TaxID=2677434 RepID=UPI0015537CB5|nr:MULTISPECIES: 2-oxoacid:acceptor oxidoreductase subunit alpha [unclassified Lentimicrobium]NPD45219.1 2-oxoacid:acceptor oxidoreductase subunit alpha [Lentimicrobium sp. S6]NPD85398.1 2-oxoacid:acceptor oxidoreductase subunit alpha [Lentimicrobium sp. L6]